MLDAEVMVDQEHTGRSSGESLLDISEGLRTVQHMDDGQHHGTRRFEQFVKIIASHAARLSPKRPLSQLKLFRSCQRNFSCKATSIDAATAASVGVMPECRSKPPECGFNLSIALDKGAFA
jgi:hypothetical protein